MPSTSPGAVGITDQETTDADTRRIVKIPGVATLWSPYLTMAGGIKLAVSSYTTDIPIFSAVPRDIIAVYKPPPGTSRDAPTGPGFLRTD